MRGIRSFCKKKGFTFTHKSLIYCAVSVNPIFDTLSGRWPMY